MNITRWMAMAAALAAPAAFLAGCGTGNDGVGAPSVPLAITDASVPATAAARTPVTYTATVRLTNTQQVFSTFSHGRASDPFSITAYGQYVGGGAAQVRTEIHEGVVTFPGPGTYTLTFTHSDPPVTRTVTVP